MRRGRGEGRVLGSRLKLSVLWLGVSLRLCKPLRAALKGAHIFVYAPLELSLFSLGHVPCILLQSGGLTWPSQLHEHTRHAGTGTDTDNLGFLFLLWVYLAYIFLFPSFPSTCSFAICTFKKRQKVKLV